MKGRFKSKEIEDWLKYPYDVGELHFPRDEGKHDFKREWWYLNLHLLNLKTNLNYDVMLTYFPKQEDMSIPMRLFMITDRQNNRFVPVRKFTPGRLIISDIKQDIKMKRFLSRDIWRQLPTSRAFQYRVEASQGKYGIDIVLRSWKPPLPVNETGLVNFGSDFSYYYSLTRLKVAGFLWVDGIRMPVIGSGWIDHQFGDFLQKGKKDTYEWFCIQLDNNVDVICWYNYVKRELFYPLMTYMFADNTVKNGKKFKIETLDYWVSPRLFKFGSKWRITESSQKLDVIVKPVIQNQLVLVPFPFEVTDTPELYLVGFYEGSTVVEGSFQGKPVRGVGYVEMTHMLD